jgi:hypothetical protein
MHMAVKFWQFPIVRAIWTMHMLIQWLFSTVLDDAPYYVMTISISSQFMENAIQFHLHSIDGQWKEAEMNNHAASLQNTMTVDCS